MLKKMYLHAAYACALLMAASCPAAVEWTNLDAENYLCGRKCSSNYLAGKVVLVCSEPELAARLEDIWESFKTKPFVILGSYAAAPEGVTYPVYRNCGLAKRAPHTPIYIVDETGALRYKGRDDRRATEVAVMTLTDMAAPKSALATRLLLDFELENLPGRALVRYPEFKKAFPSDAKPYEKRIADLAKQPDVKKLAELVAFAASAKDHGLFDPKKVKVQKAKLLAEVKSAQSKYAALKNASDPRVVREAKNALADLSWTAAELDD